MQIRVLITILVFTCSGLFFIVEANADISGCYIVKEKIPEMASGKKLTAISWMKIKHLKNDMYSVRGELTGGNHHVCTITGEKGAIQMVRRKDTLNYHTEIEYYDGIRKCDLNFNFSKTGFVITENDFNCSTVVFACGESIQLNDYTFPLSSKTSNEKCNQLTK